MTACQRVSEMCLLTWPTEEVRSLWNCTNSEKRREENAQITFANKEVTLLLQGICDNLTFKRSLLKFSPSFIPSRLNTNFEEDMDLPTFCCTTQAVECVKTLPDAIVSIECHSCLLPVRASQC